MNNFDTDSNVLTITFDSVEDANAFKIWMCESGEQDFDYWEKAGDRMPDNEFFDFEYHDPGKSQIVCKRVREEEE